MCYSMVNYAEEEIFRLLLNLPGKVVPFVNVNAISLVGYNLIEEGFLFLSTFVRPLGMEVEMHKELPKQRA